MKASDLGQIVTYYLNDKGITVSPKKLQKLLYYIEAWHLVHLNEPLIDENFEAWIHGPVLPSLYHELKKFGYNNLEIINEEEETIDKEIEAIILKNNISKNQLNLIQSVLNKYGSLDSLQLELLTHDETPWKETRGNCSPSERCTRVIPKEKMKAYYKSKIV